MTTTERTDFVKIFPRKSLFLFQFLFLFSLKTSAQTAALSCVGSLTVSLDGGCRSEITPQRVLLGNNISNYSNYDLKLVFGLEIYPDNFVSAKDIYRGVQAKITDKTTNNTCFSYIYTRDTTPPKIQPPRDIVIHCSQTDSAGVPAARISGAPIVVVECSKGSTTDYFDQSFYASCHAPFTTKPANFPEDVSFNTTNALDCSRLIVRNFWVADTFYNTAWCKQVIYIKDAKTSDIDYPVNMTIQCTGAPFNTEPDTVLINGRKMAGTGRPRYNTGAVLKSGFCQLRDSWSDTRVNFNGLYAIIRDWLIFNPCKNTTDIWSQTITVYDGVPAVTCKTNNTVNLTDTKTLELRAQDLIANASDQCTPKERLVYGIRKVGEGAGFPTTSSLRFGCGDTSNYTVEIWIKDEANRTATCNTTVRVSDAANYCAAPPLSIEGKLVRENAVAIKGNVILSDLSGASLAINALSDSFKFKDLRPEKAYKITVQRPKDWLNGVSTFDIALISKHLLGIQLLDSPYKILAADVNGDGEVSASDMLFIRKLILRQLDSIPRSVPWRFIPRNYVFPNPAEPIILDIPEYMVYNQPTDNVKNADFMAIKTGDVNLTARENTLIIAEGRGALKPLFFTFKTTETGDIIVSSEEEAVQGFQLTLNFDTHISTILNLENINLQGFNDNNYSILAEKGKITVSWNGKVQVGDLFKIKIKTLENQGLDRVQISSDLTVAEAYTPEGETRALKEQVNNKNTEGGVFELFQNTPNPFDDATAIRFNLPEPCEGQLKIYDGSGRVVKSLKQAFLKGKNEVILSVETLPSGVLFYQIQTPQNTATRKMVVLK